MTSIVYEDDELQAFWLDGSSNFVLIAFGDLVSMANGQTFSVQGPASKSDIACLGIMAKRPNWYPRANLELLWATVSTSLSPYSERILYGASMGGHGAIKSSSLMGATTTVALCPQWSINPKDATVDLGWAEYFNPQIMSGMAINASDLQGKIFVLSDPGEKRDDFHRKQLQILSGDVLAVNTHFCDHNVTPVLSGTNNFNQILSFCQTGDVRALNAFVNKVRRPHFFRKKALIEQGLSKKPALTVNVALRMVEKDALVKEIVLANASQFRRLAGKHAGQDEWNNFIFFLIQGEGDTYRKFNLTMLLRGNHRLKFVLITVFGTEVAYDPSERRLVHTTAEERDSSLLSVKLYMHNDQLEIFAENDFCRISLPDLANIEGPRSRYFDPLKVEGDQIALRRNGLFLSADPSGFLSCDRSAASEWEFFRVMVTSDQASSTETKNGHVLSESNLMVFSPLWGGLKASDHFPNDFEKAVLNDQQRNNGITICAIAKNEGRYVEEWIAYHLALGVDRIIVYSNDTQDNQNQKLEAISRFDSRVSLKEWPSKSGISPQISAYNDVLSRISTPWIAFIDIDEFIVPHKADTIQEWLATIPPDVSAVHINWRGFGSSGVESPDYELVTRTFTRAAPVGWGNHHHFKTIARSALATEAFVHNIITSTGRSTLSDFREFELVNNGLSDRIVHDDIQLNHYQCKTYQEFSARMKRGDANMAEGPGKLRDASLERFKQLDLNEEENLAIRRFDSKVDAELKQIRAVTAHLS